MQVLKIVDKEHSQKTSGMSSHFSLFNSTMPEQNASQYKQNTQVLSFAFR